jgi:hypothetical protein
MRWSHRHWLAFAPDSTAEHPRLADVPWQESPATQVVARLDLAYRGAYAVANAVPPLVAVTVAGIIEMWWCDIAAPAAVAPFDAPNHRHWRLPADVPLHDLAPLARDGQLNLEAVTQLGVSNTGQVLLADVDHWGILGVEAPPCQARVVLEKLVAGLGVPPLCSALADVTVLLDETGAVPVCPPRGAVVLMMGRPPRGLWLVQRHGTWMLEPLKVALTPVGLEHSQRPVSTGEPQQRSTS